MTLAQCLDEIRLVFLQGDSEKMSKLARKLIAELKYKYYLDQEYPRKGWFLSIEQNQVQLFNKDVSIPLKLQAQVVPIRKNSGLY